MPALRFLLLAILSAFGVLRAEETVVLSVTPEGNVSSGLAELRTPNEVRQFPGLIDNTPGLTAKGSLDSHSVLKAMELLSSAGVLKIKLEGKNSNYDYLFPIADGGRTTPWCDLSVLPRANAKRISDHVMTFPQEPNSVLVLVTVGRNELKCDSFTGREPITSFLKHLKSTYSLIAIGFEFRESAQYQDMLNALDLVKNATLNSYYFSAN